MDNIFYLESLPKYKLQCRPIRNTESVNGVVLLADAYGKAEYNVCPDGVTPKELGHLIADTEQQLVTLEFPVFRTQEERRYYTNIVVIREEKVRVWGKTLPEVSELARVWMDGKPSLSLEKPLTQTK